MECKYCKSSWNSATALKACPFCGKSLISESEELLDVSTALQKIISENGINIFSNSRCVIALVADYVKGHEREKKLLKIASSNGVLDDIIRIANETNDEKQNILIHKERQILIENAFLSEENAILILNILLEAVGIQNGEGMKQNIEAVQPLSEQQSSIIANHSINSKEKSTSQRYIVNNQTKELALIGLDLFEFDGSSYDSIKTSGQVFLKNETRYIAARLMFERPQTDTDIELSGQIFDENGNAYTDEQTSKGKITPKDTGYYISWGWPTAGNWPIGKYKVVAKANGSKEWTNTFEIINGSFSHPNIRLNYLRMFYGGDVAPVEHLREYTNSFQKTKLQRVFFELHFQPIYRNYYTTINYKITYPDGSVYAHYAVPLQLQSGWDKCWVGCGWSEAGYWSEGLYKYEVSIGNSDALSGAFLVE